MYPQVPTAKQTVEFFLVCVRLSNFHHNTVQQFFPSLSFLCVAPVATTVRQRDLGGFPHE